MSFHNPFFPLPMYVINSDLEITKENQAATSSLIGGLSMLDIVEQESRYKVEKHLRQFKTIEALEVNVISSSSDILLADLYTQWTNGAIGEVVIVKKDQALIHVSTLLNRLRTRLTDTNFELLHAKEATESLLHENIKLSSPFIEITDRAALVPIFGELNEEKTGSIASTLIRRAYLSTVETIIIDFTAVGHIIQGGLSGFEKLVGMMQLLGFSIVVVGLHPNHAKEWHALEFNADIRFVKSLRIAIQDIIIPKTSTY